VSDRNNNDIARGLRKRIEYANDIIYDCYREGKPCVGIAPGGIHQEVANLLHPYDRATEVDFYTQYNKSLDPKDKVDLPDELEPIHYRTDGHTFTLYHQGFSFPIEHLYILY